MFPEWHPVLPVTWVRADVWLTRSWFTEPKHHNHAEGQCSLVPAGVWFTSPEPGKSQRKINKKGLASSGV